MEKAESSKKRKRDGDSEEEGEQAPPPLALQPLQQQQVADGGPFDWTPIFDRVKHSLVFVLLEPKEDRLEDIQTVANRVETVKGRRSRRRRVRRGYSSTGFVYANGPLGPLIMTCAHGLQHVYKASDPLTPATANMFRVSVLCDHQEMDFQLNGAVGNRRYGNARITGYDCATDTLMIGVMRDELKNLGDGVCPHNHPALVIAESIPREVKPCMLISWPPHRPRTVAVGWTGSPRVSNGTCWPNRAQYNMHLLEVYMTTERGSSGAPLIDTKGDVIGILHGGFEGSHSYFVAAQHLYQWQFGFVPRVGAP